MSATLARRSNPEVLPVSVLIAVCGIAGVARAADQADLDRFIPERAGWYLRLPRPDRVESVLRRESLRPWVDRLAQVGAGDAASASLRGLSQRFLGPESAIPPDELLACEWMMVGPTFGEVLRGAWLIRLPDDAALDRWFPKDRRQFERRVRQARLIRMRDGTFVCEREGVISLARRFSDPELVRSLQTLMALGSVGGRPLAERRDYRDLLARLDRDPLFVVYTAKRVALPAENRATDALKNGESDVAPASAPPARADDKRPSSALPNEELDLNATLIGVYDRGDAMEVVIRSESAAPSASAPLSNQAMERLMNLPQTTLAAVALTMDFGRAFSAGVSENPPDAVQRYLKLLGDLSRGDAARNPVLTRIGPDVILVWGQDLGDEGDVPQFAVMVRSPDARGVRGEITKLARNLIGLIQAVDPVPPEAAPTFKLVSYLGTAIVHVPLSAYSSAGKLPFAKAVRSLDPAWTSWRDWVILALHRSHVERILDAQADLAPTLAGLPEVLAFRDEARSRRVAAIVQTGLAAELVRDWLTRSNSDAASLWSALWWSDDAGWAPQGLPTLPELVEDEITGSLVVDAVEDMPLTCPLLPGDQVLGVDGQLLRLREVEEDFKERIAKSTKPAGPELRVLREGRLIDVTLPREAEDQWRMPLSASPVNLLREFAEFGETVRLTTVSVSAEQDRRIETRLSFRFTVSKGE